MMNRKIKVPQKQEVSYDRVLIGKEYFYIETPERFAWILEEKLGRDAANYFRNLIATIKFDEGLCPGECDRTYRIQEHYQRVIRDGLEALEEAQIRKLGYAWGGQMDTTKYTRAVRMLGAGL